MKFITKVSQYSILHCSLIFILAILPVSSRAQDVIVIDTSSPRALLVDPTIVMTEVPIEPDCNTYTGCGLLVLKTPPKVIRYKVKRHRVYHPPCCVRCNYFYYRPVRHCW